MELRHIKHFLALCRQQSFSRAAEQLNLAQPTLSRSIQKMETLLGVSLLDRSAGGFALTPDGALVYEHGEQLVKQMDALETALLTLRGEYAGQIAIGCVAGQAGVLGPVLGKLMRDYPAITLDLSLGDSERLLQLLLVNQINLAIVDTHLLPALAQDELSRLSLPASALGFYCRPEHPLLGEPRLYLERLRDFPLAVPAGLAPDIGSKFGDIFDSNRHDFAGIVRFNDFRSVDAVLAASDLVALTTRESIQRELATGALVQLEPANMPEACVQYSLVWRKQAHVNPLLEHVISGILEQAWPGANFPAE
ncbi:LysR family transcriptional regulator [Shewanella sedimentimangrovi]|uniref:LysR family transcriptional regulator n=1 Tax=Shewanella sedimentimangrovi TaxID=2814293 RepID=A0ABX7R0E9_9GAMM|nr:LysR family transcriptional regulator [Shewanella sedimentimangrovi]QSX36353.1 LysR family transcriptional regulator [Shewanella sedimentimangrovi]